MSFVGFIQLVVLFRNAYSLFWGDEEEIIAFNEDKDIVVYSI
jgi:hypothetical protein